MNAVKSMYHNKKCYLFMVVDDCVLWNYYFQLVIMCNVIEIESDYECSLIWPKLMIRFA